MQRAHAAEYDTLPEILARHNRRTHHTAKTTPCASKFRAAREETTDWADQ